MQAYWCQGRLMVHTTRPPLRCSPPTCCESYLSIDMHSQTQAFCQLMPHKQGTKLHRNGSGIVYCTLAMCFMVMLQQKHKRNWRLTWHGITVLALGLVDRPSARSSRKLTTENGYDATVVTTDIVLCACREITA